MSKQDYCKDTKERSRKKSDKSNINTYLSDNLSINTEFEKDEDPSCFWLFWYITQNGFLAAIVFVI